MKKKVLFIFIFILGLGIFSFPIISNLYNNRVHYTLMADYDRSIDSAGAARLEEDRRLASEYNRSLTGGQLTVADPFSKESLSGEAETILDYQIKDVIGLVEIPKIDVKLPILVGTTDDVLVHGVGYMLNSSFPVGGQGTHTVLTGHRGLPTSELFRNLDKMEIGDRFYISSLGQKLAYEVDQIKIVNPDEVEELAIQADQDYATLITCHPYAVNTFRMLVRGRQVPYTADAEYTGTHIDNFRLLFDRYQEYIISILLIVLLLIILAVADRIRKRKK